MEQLTKGLLTIGIPAFNGGANLPDLISSIKNLGLSEEEYEIVVVDNCSDDNTEEVIEQLKKQINNLRYFKNQDNIGRIQNWNKVIDVAQGEYLIIMNINDRFLEFNAKKHLQYLDRHQELSLIFTDIENKYQVYPNWLEEGTVELDAYLKHTFLDPDYLEYNSLGVLHQHIFRTQIIIDNNLRFDHKIPRTTDRVFTAEAINAGGGIFYYSPNTMIVWNSNTNRYHYNVHSKNTDFNFDELWINEYKANTKLAELAGIAFKDILQSLMIFARFYMVVNKIRGIKEKIFRRNLSLAGMEIPTAGVFYSYLKIMAKLNKVSINYFYVKGMALRRATNSYFNLVDYHHKSKKSLAGIIKPFNDIIP